MRILFADRTLPYLLRDMDYPVGGWAVQLHQLLTGLHAIGLKAGVLTWKGANAYVGAQDLCDLVETYDPDSGIRKLRLFTSWIPSLLAAIRGYAPDVIVQSCSGFDTALFGLASRMSGVPFVHRIACDTDTDGRFVLYLDLRGRLSFRLGLRLSSFVICQNSYQLEQIRKRYPRKPAGVLHNAFGTPSALATSPQRSERRYVAWVGVYKRQKNLPLLLRVARALPNVRFQVAGAPPARLDADTAAAFQELKLLDNVTLAGYVRRAEIPDLMKGGIALLSTSDFEGFSNTFLEAFAAGTPVVARAAVDPDGIIARHGLGFIAGDEMQVTARLEQLCALDSVTYQDMSRRCRAYVTRYHRPEQAATELVRMMESLVSHR